MTDVTSHICGGYYLVKKIKRPQDVSDPAPLSFITLSSCFSETAPDDWAHAGYNYTEAERANEALNFGIAASNVPEVVSLFTQEQGALPPNAFASLSTAEAFYRQCENQETVALVGIGLHPSLLPSLYAQRENEVNHGYGLLERVEMKVPLAPGREVLGYEPLGYDGMHFHSWLCHNAPKAAWEKLKIGPNQHGFINTLEDAISVTEDLTATGAERAMWEPWLVVQYGVG